MLKLEILNILRDPHLTVFQQADMLAEMMQRRSRDIYKYVKAQAQDTIVREREQYQDRIDRAYDDGLKNGYHMGLNDGEAQDTILREREESAKACERAYERGWDQGYEDCTDHYEEAKRLGTDIAF